MTGRKGRAALLMRRSVDAFFRMDSDGRLVESNEAFTQPADPLAPVTDREVGFGYEFTEPPRPVHPGVIELGEGREADALFAPFAAEGAKLEPIRPFLAILRNGAVVSSCYSARLTDLAAEAGVDTDDEYRGRGFAAAVVNAWRVAIEADGRIPLYSASADNTSSRAVARRLGLSQYAETLWLT